MASIPKPEEEWPELWTRILSNQQQVVRGMLEDEELSLEQARQFLIDRGSKQPYRKVKINRA
jgi:hypothetical protein